MGKGESAAAAATQRLSVCRVQGVTGGAGGTPPPLRALLRAEKEEEEGGVSAGPEPGLGRRGDTPLPLALGRQPGLPSDSSAASCLHGRKSRSPSDT